MSKTGGDSPNGAAIFCVSFAASGLAGIMVMHMSNTVMRLTYDPGEECKGGFTPSRRSCRGHNSPASACQRPSSDCVAFPRWGPIIAGSLKTRVGAGFIQAHPYGCEENTVACS